MRIESNNYELCNFKANSRVVTVNCAKRGFRRLHATILAFLFLCILYSNGFATCDPPNYGGDWTILATENCGNHSIELNITGDVLVYGNLSLNNTLLWVNDDLIIYAGGNISFDNSTIRLNGTTSGAATIDVRADGRFNVTNGTMIENGVIDALYDFDFDDGSHGFINDSTIKDSCKSGTGSCANDGLSIKDSNGYIVVENCTLIDNGNEPINLDPSSANIRIFNNTILQGSRSPSRGIMCRGTGHQILNNYIAAGTDAGIYTGGTNLNISGNEHIQGSGANAHGIRTATTNGNITNNTIYGSTNQEAIGFEGGAFTIDNNTIIASDTSKIAVGTGLANSILSNNVITGRVYGTGSNTIENNQITGNSAWITMSLTASNIITNNTITTGWYSMSLGGNNNEVENNTLMGTRVYITGDNNWIFNNTIRSIYMDGSTDNIIANNTLTGSGSYSPIGLYSSCDNNNISNNSINGTGWGGIYADNSGHSNIRINNNTIGSATIHGIHFLSGSSSLFILGNNFTYNTRAAINLNATTTQVIDSNNFENNGASFEYSSYSSIIDAEEILANNTFQGNDAITFIFNISNGTIANTTMPTATTYNASLSGNSQVTWINVTHDRTALAVYDTSKLNVGWWVDFHTVKSDYTPIGLATVRLINTSGIQVGYGTTDSNGYLARKSVTEYEQYSAGRSDFNNYNFTAEMQTYIGSNNSINISTNSVDSVYITLEPDDSSAQGGGGGPKDEKEEDEENITEDGGGGGSGYTTPPKYVSYMEGIIIIPTPLVYEDVVAGEGASKILDVRLRGNHTISFKSDQFWITKLPEGPMVDRGLYNITVSASVLENGSYYGNMSVYVDGVLAASVPVLMGVGGKINILDKLGIDKTLALAILLIIIFLVIYSKKR